MAVAPVADPAPSDRCHYRPVALGMIDSMESGVLRAGRPDDGVGIARVHVEGWRAAYRGIVPDGFLAEPSVPDRQRR